MKNHPYHFIMSVLFALLIPFYIVLCVILLQKGTDGRFFLAGAVAALFSLVFHTMSVKAEISKRKTRICKNAAHTATIIGNVAFLVMFFKIRQTEIIVLIFLTAGATVLASLILLLLYHYALQKEKSQAEK